MDPQSAWLSYNARRLGIHRSELLRRVILAYWRYIGRDVLPDPEGKVHAMRPYVPQPAELVRVRPRDALIDILRRHLIDPSYPVPPRPFQAQRQHPPASEAPTGPEGDASDV